jgi:hypothetical protein
MTRINEEALEAARLAVEDALIELRDARIGILNGGNGFVVREYDGKESSIMRMSTRDGLRIGIKAYLAALDGEYEMEHADNCNDYTGCQEGCRWVRKVSV